MIQVILLFIKQKLQRWLKIRSPSNGKLLEQGFSEELAEQLVVEFQNTYWTTLLSVNKPNHDQ